MAWTTPELFAVFGVDTAIGRLLRPEEGRTGVAAHKALISHHLWQTTSGGRPDILQQSLDLPTTVYPIVGVMPKGFRFPDSTDIWIPIASGVTVATGVDPERMPASRSCAVIGRLRPGITMREEQADLARIPTRMEQDHPVANRDTRPIVMTLRDAEVGKRRPYLVLLVGSVGLMLLLCCVNVANLFLSRTTAGVREMSIRVALGAGGAVIVRQLLIESLFLCACAGLTGAGIAVVSIRLFDSLISDRAAIAHRDRFTRLGVDRRGLCGDRSSLRSRPRVTDGAGQRQRFTERRPRRFGGRGRRAGARRPRRARGRVLGRARRHSRALDSQLRESTADADWLRCARRDHGAHFANSAWHADGQASRLLDALSPRDSGARGCNRRHVGRRDRRRAV